MNCGKTGHFTKACIEPITSCGIICFKIDNISLTKIDKFLFNKYIDIEDYNYSNLNYYNKINFHRNDIKFLMIQRKHSFSYIEFLRGKYNETDETKLQSMFELMSKNEVADIKNNDFDYLWNKLWNKTAQSKSFIKECNISKNKFNNLKNNNLLNNLESKYENPEWGFPKGRRNKFENNSDCANREFIEETCLTNYTLFDRIKLMEETFTGTDLINYKHIYYIAGSEEKDLAFSSDNYEIGNIGWFTIDEILYLLRPYNKGKINIINQIYFFLSIMSDKIKSNNIDKTNSPNKNNKKNQFTLHI